MLIFIKIVLWCCAGFSCSFSLAGLYASDALASSDRIKAKIIFLLISVAALLISYKLWFITTLQNFTGFLSATLVVTTVCLLLAIKYKATKSEPYLIAAGVTSLIGLVGFAILYLPFAV